MAVYTEPARQVPIVGQSDVVICGAGPAGVVAAIAAARAGANVQLLELHGCLGGMWTSGSISWVIDAAAKRGLMQEIAQRLDARGARYSSGRDWAYDVEQMKRLLEEMCLEVGVQFQYHTRVVAAGIEDRRLTTVLTESASGRQAWQATVFIDCTGNGDLAAQAGCAFEVGRPGSQEMQPMSLLILLTGLDEVEADRYISHPDVGHAQAKAALTAEMQAAGADPSYHGQTLFHLGGELYSLSGNHVYGHSGTDATELTRATVQARQEMHRLIDALRARGGVWRNLRIVATAEQIGVRDGRRVAGRYTVTVKDMLEGRRHADAVAHVTLGIDVHTTDPTQNKAYSPENRTRTLPYDIPIGACIARDVDGLLLAGRCISGDFLAHASYRMTATAAALGQGAGCLAAVAASQGRLPQDVPWEDVAPLMAALEETEPVGA